MPDNKVSSKNTIKIDVALNEDKHPVGIAWNSSANPEGTSKQLEIKN